MNRCLFVLNPPFLLYQSAWRPSVQINKTIPFFRNVPFFRSKGHSKWQNIRHTKEAKDREKAVIFNKYINLMKVAIVEGGNSDPEYNTALANLIASARRHNMPNSSIQGALKGNKEKPMQTGWVELKGPKGTLLYVSLLAPSVGHVRQNMKSIVRKLKSKVEFTERMAKAVLDHKGIILAEPPPGLKNVEETSFEHAIEVGAEEVSPLEGESNVLEFITPASSMHKVRGALEALNYVIKEAECVYIPKAIIELDDEEEQSLQKLYEELSKLPEVVQIYTNF